MTEFTQTEEFKLAGEGRVVEAVKAAFHGRDAVGWWRYPLVTETNVREPDILVLDAELGVIEVKSLPLSDLAAVSGYCWSLHQSYFGRREINPFEQARAQLQVVLRSLPGRPGLERVTVAVPLGGGRAAASVGCAG